MLVAAAYSAVGEIPAFTVFTVFTMSDETIHTPILVAGGGSIGLCLAAELGWRGVSALVVEDRLDINPHPRANSIASRTMEYCRRWGIAGGVSQCGIPPDVQLEYLWITHFQGHVLHRLSIPSYDSWKSVRKHGGAMREELTWSPYLKTITGQNEFEGVVREYVKSRPSIHLRQGWHFLGFEQDEREVRSRIRRLSDGREFSVVSQYLVACDGGRSEIRQALGIGLSGEADIAQFVSIHFRAPGLVQCHDFGPAAIYFPLHREHMGFFLNWDTGQRWTYHVHLKPGQQWNDVDPLSAIRGVLGCDTPVELLSVQPWTAHALVADRYRAGRVFLAGDAAHLFTPTGGFGMNTGASDAVELAWRLQAMLDGWGGEALLASYEPERRPIGFRNTAEAARNYKEMRSVMGFGDEMDETTPAGDERRATLKHILVGQEKLLASFGVVLGYRFSDSPIVVPDGSPEPSDDARFYVPAGRPGHRAPHVWLADDTALMDRFGPGFNLLCFAGENAETAAFAAAARRRGVPLTVLAIDHAEARRLYGANHALVRPDLMMAWRGDRIADPETILDLVTGRGGESGSARI